MDEFHCEHSWGESEEVELGHGIVRSPLCKHCGAVQFEVRRQAAERRRADWVGQEALLRAANQSSRRAQT